MAVPSPRPMTNMPGRTTPAYELWGDLGEDDQAHGGDQERWLGALTPARERTATRPPGRARPSGAPSRSGRFSTGEVAAVRAGRKTSDGARRPAHCHPSARPAPGRGAGAKGRSRAVPRGVPRAVRRAVRRGGRSAAEGERGGAGLAGGRLRVDGRARGTPVLPGARPLLRRLHGRHPALRRPGRAGRPRPAPGPGSRAAGPVIAAADAVAAVRAAARERRPARTPTARRRARRDAEGGRGNTTGPTPPFTYGSLRRAADPADAQRRPLPPPSLFRSPALRRASAIALLAGAGERSPPPVRG